MAETINNYKILGFIASGTYGSLWSISKEGKIYALKRERLKEKTGDLRSTVLLESDILLRVKYPNLLNAIEVFADDEKIYYILEKADYSLARVLYSKTCRISGPLVVYWAFNILCGIKYLHKHNFIHADLKPDNVLLFNDGTLKIADYGLTKRNFEQDKNTNVQSIWWKAPEVILQNHYYTSSIDIWSFGVILFELVFGTIPFPNKSFSEEEQLLSIFRVLGWPDPNSNLGKRVDSFEGLRAYKKEKGIGYVGIVGAEEWDRRKAQMGKNFNELINIINQCFNYEEDSRSTADELLKNPIFKEYDEPSGNYLVGDFKYLELETRNRNKLFDFLEEVRKELDFSYVTLLLAEDMLERINFLMGGNIPLSLLQVYGMTCFILSAKLIEGKFHSIETYEKMCSGACEKSKILELEVFIFKKLGFLLYSDNLITYCKNDPEISYRYVKQLRSQNKIQELRNEIRARTFDCDRLIGDLQLLSLSAD